MKNSNHFIFLTITLATLLFGANLFTNNDFEHPLAEQAPQSIKEQSTVAHTTQYFAEKANKNNSTMHSSVSSNQQVLCLDICQQSLEKLQWSNELSDKEKQYMLAQAKLLAAQLYKTPQLAADIIAQLFGDETPANQNHFEVIENLIAQLNNQQKTHIAQVLSTTGVTSNRQIALHLLSDDVINTPQGFAVFQQLLDSATSQQVLNKALNIVPRITNQQQKLALLDNLTKLMNYSDSIHTYGVSLMTKVAITTDPALMHHEVITAIEHSDNDAKHYGLKAIETILKQEAASIAITENSDDGHRMATQWTSNEEIELALINLADNSNFPAKLRNKALNLTEEYF